MKIKFLSSLILVALLLMGCEDDNTPDIVINDNSTVNNTTGGGNGNGGDDVEELFGFINEDTTLDPDITYRLAAAVFVDNCATLTIPAGTRIEAEPNGVQNYIAVLRCSQIIINGTASNPVVMTSASSNPGPGDWGGLVILGQGTTNLFDPAEPDDLPTSEVGQLPYGGEVAGDDSGSINYLRLEYVGGALNGTQELNGLSLYAVSAATEINFVQIFESSDDGIEFFGGDVNVNNLAVVGAEDDSVDWTEGYTGTVTDVYVEQTLDGDSAFEMDGFNTDFQNSGGFVSIPTINDVTVVGSADNSRAFRLRAGTGGIFNNVVIEDFGRGVVVEDDTPGDITSDNIPANLQFTDVLFTNVTTEFIYEDDFMNMNPPTQADVIGGSSANATGTDYSTWGAGWTIN
ncbi:multidrug transporter [Winogradskyella sp.]|uniref:multidrug transporter n=1 Tax=Winogradskyella sp. TaxID=1883156 RepID=UPI00262E47F1|nr:multidrug transporter [Winogradskyella sp.]